MPDKKIHESDTIRQQRKAREEFLELKRMQSGEIEVPAPPSAESTEPKTFKEKLQNFWFYNRIAVFSVLFVAIVMAVGIVQCASRVDYDLNIVLYTASPVDDGKTQMMSEYFKKFCSDVNGDGEVNISVLNCSYASEGNLQLNQAVDTKVQALLVSEPESMLFIVDDVTLARLNSIPSTTPLFSDGGIDLSDSFYSSVQSEDLINLPDNLKLVRRNIADTTMQKNKNAAACYKAAGLLLEKVAKDNS